MKTHRGPRSRIAIAMFACFVTGGAVGWWLYAGPPMPSIDDQTTISGPAAHSAHSGGEAGQHWNPEVDRPPAAAGSSPSSVVSGFSPSSVLSGSSPSSAVSGSSPSSVVSGSSPSSAVSGSSPSSVVSGFSRTAGTSETIDDLRGRGLRLPIDGGDVESFYQYDPGGPVCYDYAHLDRYADGLSEGSKASRGDVIGFVGTSGSAPANTPHLHFAVFELTADRHWWQGTPIDPYQVFPRPARAR